MEDFSFVFPFSCQLVSWNLELPPALSALLVCVDYIFIIFISKPADKPAQDDPIVDFKIKDYLRERHMPAERFRLPTTAAQTTTRPLITLHSRTWPGGFSFMRTAGPSLASSTAESFEPGSSTKFKYVYDLQDELKKLSGPEVAQEAKLTATDKAVAKLYDTQAYVSSTKVTFKGDQPA
jgi:hypothetical protein